MCLILLQHPLPELKQLNITRSLINKNILDYGCFAPIVEGIKCYLSYKHRFEEWCELNNKDYNNELRSLCEITTTEIDYYEVICPTVLRDTVRFKPDERLSILWNYCVQDFIKNGGK